MPHVTWKQTSGYWWPQQHQQGVCGYYCCAIVAALLNPNESRFKLAVKAMARNRVWASRLQIYESLSNDFKIHCVQGGNEHDPADTDALELQFGSVSKTKPMIVACVGPNQGQNHWVVVSQKLGQRVLVIDPYVGPVWGDVDGFSPNYIPDNAFFAGLYVKVV